jgi:hypothetical protein
MTACLIRKVEIWRVFQQDGLAVVRLGRELRTANFVNDHRQRFLVVIETGGFEGVPALAHKALQHRSLGGELRTKKTRENKKKGGVRDLQSDADRGVVGGVEEGHEPRDESGAAREALTQSVRCHT